MSQPRPYYAAGSLSAAFYDVVTAADARLSGDADLYAGLAPTGGAVLELGAGSGRLAAALAERGLSVLGVEIAPAMLAQARARVAGLGAQVAARIELRQGDMTALDLKRTFDLVLCPYFTLAHVPAGAAWRNTFATAAKHLKSDGLFAAHLPLREMMRLPGPDPLQVVLAQPLPSGGTLQLRILERRFREDIGRLDQVIDYAELDAGGRTLRRSPEQLTYFIADPEPFAAGAGFALDRPPVPLGGVGEVWVFRKID